MEPLNRHRGAAPGTTRGVLVTRPSRRAAAVLVALSVTAGPIALAGPASAGSHAGEGGSSSCTVTAAQRVVLRDERTALRHEPAGHKPTKAEKKALRAAVDQAGRRGGGRQA
ncbi:hypothetical protein GCM10025868_38270 [Angustibacter aerolatus]|uniref:Haemophore haem-binding domain-containing protein n=1 Tax=Angustibacter aerolatus TaxID=1162965 RepID=A0ABQ6JP11_9ACTN|nr:hypothetical protein GCM10025868_38270 [Angustibacter aerolatus]